MKQRLDLLLVEQGYISGRDKAKAVIMAGDVYVNGQKAVKSGDLFDTNANIEIRGNLLRYVSRGGLKLEKAMEEFPICLRDAVCMDIGASTGGFTDCMLQNGAKKVFAVDVGYGQLAWKLRQDERVIVMERTNIRYVTSEDIAEPIDFISIDVSFISLSLVLPVAWNLLSKAGAVVALVKPQFEAGKDQVGKKGVVKDPSVHLSVLESTVAAAQSIGFSPEGISYSPIKGPEGNIEYLLFLNKKEQVNFLQLEDLEKIVSQSHQQL